MRDEAQIEIDLDGHKNRIDKLEYEVKKLKEEIKHILLALNKIQVKTFI